MTGQEAASILEFYDALGPWLLAFIRAFTELALPMLAVGLALQEWPRWKPRAITFALMGLAPAWLVIYAIYYMLVADEYGAISKPGLIPWSNSKMLMDYLFVLPGAAAALELRRRLFPEEAEREDRERAEPALAERRRALVIRQGFIAGLGLTAISFALFCLVNLDPHPKLVELNELAGEYPTEGQAAMAIGRMFSAVLLEELVWRAMFQTFVIWALKGLIGRRPAILAAILASSALWTLTHPFNLAFAWAKYAQIMCLGLVLGWLMEFRGVYACMLAHAVHNGALFYYAVMGGDFIKIFGYEKPLMTPWFIVIPEAQ